MNKQAATSIITDIGKPKVVLKIGGALNVPNGNLDANFIRKICKQVADLSNDFHFNIVISGAIPLGTPSSDINIKTVSIFKRCLYAAEGQIKLVNQYMKGLKKYHIRSGQLLYETNVSDDHRKHVLREFYDENVIPLINANDPNNGEWSGYDNDFLGANVAGIIKADYYIMLSRSKGIEYRSEQSKYLSQQKIDCDNGVIRTLSSELITTELMCYLDDGTTSRVGSNGPTPKAFAAKQAVDIGKVFYVYIANGHEPNVITRIFAGEKIGTRIY